MSYEAGDANRGMCEGLGTSGSRNPPTRIPSICWCPDARRT